MPDQPATGFVVLAHTSCGHIALGPSLDPRLVEGYRQVLAAAGYHDWQVQPTDITSTVLAKVGDVCDVCAADPERMRIALEVAACAQDADTRLAATLGAATRAAAAELAAERGELS